MAPSPSRCIAEDKRPYLRRPWLLGWAGACPRHRIVLIGQCRNCWCPIWLLGPDASSPADLLACQGCGGRLVGSAAQPAHATVLDVQAALVAGKRTGALDLPGIGEIDWTT
jgi:hypothetical protein